MKQDVNHFTLPNGLTILAERMDHVRSATVSFLIPGGCSYDPPDQLGMGAILAEMLSRGAGERDAEQLSLAFDRLGVDHGETVGLLNMGLFGGTLARNVPFALELFADMVLRPTLPEEELESVQSLLIQDLQGLEDSPQDKVMIELRKRYYPSPLNRDRCGSEDGIEAVTIASLRNHHRKQLRPNGTILSIAGNIDWSMIRDKAEELFGDWPMAEVTKNTPTDGVPTSEHLHKETQQTQIAIAFPSVPMSHPAYFAARGAVGVLSSSGMSSRLFTEVREKRGLCYSVYASHETLKDRGTIYACAGSRAERAQETLDVMLAELRRLKDGIEIDEIDRMRASLKTSLIMQQESTSARAGAIARDWYHLGRVRSFDETQREIDGLNVSAVLDYASAFPFETPTLVTLGPAPLVLPA